LLKVADAPMRHFLQTQRLGSSGLQREDGGGGDDDGDDDDGDYDWKDYGFGSRSHGVVEW